MCGSAFLNNNNNTIGDELSPDFYFLGEGVATFISLGGLVEFMLEINVKLVAKFHQNVEILGKGIATLTKSFFGKFFNFLN